MAYNITVITGTGSASITISTGARGPAGSDATAAALTYAGSDPNMAFAEITGTISPDRTGVYPYLGNDGGIDVWGDNDTATPEVGCTQLRADLNLGESTLVHYTSLPTADSAKWLGGLEGALTPDGAASGAASLNFNPLAATHLGQHCYASTAVWEWDGSSWIPRFTLAGDPIAYNATLSAFRKLVVSGADGSEIITISAL